MTLREFAKGYDGNIMLKAFENEKSTTPTAIMMTQIADSIKDEVLDKEVYSYTMVCASLFIVLSALILMLMLIRLILLYWRIVHKGH